MGFFISCYYPVEQLYCLGELLLIAQFIRAFKLFNCVFDKFLAIASKILNLKLISIRVISLTDTSIPINELQEDVVVSSREQETVSFVALLSNFELLEQLSPRIKLGRNS